MNVKEYFKDTTRKARWKLIQILSPSIWFKYQGSQLNGLPRGSTKHAVNYFKGRPITYCEIGVHKGYNVADVNNRLNVSHNYLIDIYEEYKEFPNVSLDERVVILTKELQDEAFKIAKKELKEFDVTWIIEYSDIAVNELPDDIDFIYIDGNHDYEFIKKDIELYWEKVAKGGILAGHDFFGRFNGVVNAVCEFSTEKGLFIYSDNYDWWFIKEDE